MEHPINLEFNGRGSCEQRWSTAPGWWRWPGQGFKTWDNQNTPSSNQLSRPEVIRISTRLSLFKCVFFHVVSFYIQMSISRLSLLVLAVCSHPNSETYHRSMAEGPSMVILFFSLCVKDRFRTVMRTNCLFLSIFIDMFVPEVLL